MPHEQRPDAEPDEVVDQQEDAAAVARMCRGTRCWTAVASGASHRMLSALAISNSGHATHRLGASSPATNSGAVISQAIAGSLAYQPRSPRPGDRPTSRRRKCPTQPPMRTGRPEEIARSTEVEPEASHQNGRRPQREAVAGSELIDRGEGQQPKRRLASKDREHRGERRMRPRAGRAACRGRRKGRTARAGSRRAP